MNRDEILDKAARAMQREYAAAETLDPRWIARSTAMYRDRFKTGLDAVEGDIRADERAQLVAGDLEACAGWLRYTLDTLGVSASRSDDLAEELAALVGSFVEMKLRHERERAAALLTQITVKPCGPGHAGHVGIVTLLDAIEKIKKGLP